MPSIANNCWKPVSLLTAECTVLSARRVPESRSCAKHDDARTQKRTLVTCSHCRRATSFLQRRPTVSPISNLGIQFVGNWVLEQPRPLPRRRRASPSATIATHAVSGWPAWARPCLELRAGGGARLKCMLSGTVVERDACVRAVSGQTHILGAWNGSLFHMAGCGQE